MLKEEEVRRICRLARIQVSDEERALLQIRFEKVLGHFQALAKLNTKGVAPMYHGAEALELREDVVEEPLDRNLLMKNAPDSSEGCFRIPKVVGGVES